MEKFLGYYLCDVPLDEKTLLRPKKEIYIKPDQKGNLYSYYDDELDIHSYKYQTVLCLEDSLDFEIAKSWRKYVIDDNISGDHDKKIKENLLSSFDAIEQDSLIPIKIREVELISGRLIPNLKLHFKIHYKEDDKLFSYKYDLGICCYSDSYYELKKQIMDAIKHGWYWHTSEFSAFEAIKEKYLKTFIRVK